MPFPFPARANLIPAGALLPSVFKTYLAVLYDSLAATMGTDGPVAPPNVASAATVDLSVLTGRQINITGVVAITAFTVPVGWVFQIKAAGAFTLTNNANIVTSTGANIVAASGDSFTLRATAANTVEVIGYTRVTPVSALISASYNSGSLTITSAGTTGNLAHGLGAVPKILDFYLLCLSADVGYGSGDIVRISGGQEYEGSSSKGIGVTFDATNINVRFGGAGNVFTLINKTTGAAGGITNASWKLVIRAYA